MIEKSQKTTSLTKSSPPAGNRKQTFVNLIFAYKRMKFKRSLYDLVRTLDGIVGRRYLAFQPFWFACPIEFFFIWSEALMEMCVCDIFVNFNARTILYMMCWQAEYLSLLQYCLRGEKERRGKRFFGRKILETAAEMMYLKLMSRRELKSFVDCLRSSQLGECSRGKCTRLGTDFSKTKT